jgi:ketosteroid isomerase-like protein
MRIACLSSLLIITTTAFAQIRPEVESIAQAERDFAQVSVDQNIRAAFLTNFDDETLAFQKGEPLPGRRDWLAREPNDAYLFWWPVFADVASSGDFGYTTGPAVFGGTQSEKKPTGGMYYASVWKKKRGKWTVVADLGTGIYDPAENMKDFTTSQNVLKKTKKKIDTQAEQSALLTLDKKYANDLSEAKASFQTQMLSQEARIHRPGRKPITTPTEVVGLQEKGKFTFEQVGGEIATSADMGFTYGRVKVMVIRDEKETLIPLCYMRVWKKEGGTWKVVLDVIG